MLATGLLHAFLAIPSVTGREAPLAASIESWCKEQGWTIFREAVTADRYNLYINPESSKPLLFTTHLDTVPGDLPVTTTKDFITGRGSCDAKGALAAMLSAGVLLQEQGHVPSFLFLVGEETDSIGAKSVKNLTSEKRWIVNGEPTENLLATGHKGVLSYRLHTSGVSVHSGYPEHGSSAIHAMLTVLGEIQNCIPVEPANLGRETVNFGLITGGSALNVLADSCECTVMHRLVDPAQLALDRVRTAVGNRAEIHPISTTDPQECTVLEGFPTAAMAYGSDIPYLRKFGTPMMYGPGSILDAHTEHERVSIAGLEQAARDYANIGLRIIKEANP